MTEEEITKVFDRDTFLSWLEKQDKTEWPQGSPCDCALAEFSGEEIMSCSPAYNNSNSTYIMEARLPPWAQRVSSMRSIDTLGFQERYSPKAQIVDAALDRDPTGRFTYEEDQDE